MNNYQLNYAANRPQMYDFKVRSRKAKRIIKTLEDYYKKKNKLTNLVALDVGSSTGIIDSILAKSFKKVTGTDIDKKAVSFAKKEFGRKSKNLSFKVEDAMKLSFKKNTFDVVICTQVYEHVPNSQKLFDEIHRVLKNDGVCYLAALNRLWPLEPHYNLLFLSWLPKSLADIYIKIMRNKNEYYEHPLDYWQLRNMLKKFSIEDYTAKILNNPTRYGYPKSSKLVSLFSPILKYLTPTFFWILIKN